MELAPSDIIQKLSDDYPQNWIMGFDLAVENAEESKNQIKSKFISSSNNIFIWLNSYLLTGGYIQNLSTSLSSEFEKIEQSLQDISQTIEIPENEQLQSELQQYFIINLLNPIKYSLKRLKRYFKDFENDLSFDDFDRVLQASKKREIEFSFTNMDKGIQTSSRAFDTCLAVSKFDWKISYSDNTIKELLLIKREIESLYYEPISLKLTVIDKINFLLRKIYYRSCLERKKGRRMIYSFDLEDSELSLDQNELTDLLNPFDSYCQIHYGIDPDFKKEQRTRIRAVYKKDVMNYTLSDYHSLIKIYKDDNRNLEQVINLYNSYKTYYANKIKEDITSFDNAAYSISYNYIFNNYISIKLEKTDQIELLKDLYRDAKQVQKETLIKNYFPYFRLAQRCIELLNKENEDNEGRIKKYKREDIEFLEKCIFDMSEYLKWCRVRNFLHFQLPYSECLSDKKVALYDEKEYNVFISSTFVIPLNYEKVQTDLTLLEKDLIKFQTLTGIFDKIFNLIRNVELIEDSVRKQEKKSTEVLAIFSAIALFAIGNIQIFSAGKLKENIDYFNFILCFGYCLTLFVLLIWLITRDAIRNITILHWIFLGTYIVGSFLTLNHFLHLL